MESRLRIKSLDQILSEHRFINIFDSQQEGKHSYFSSELLEEEICSRITPKKNKQ